MPRHATSSAEKKARGTLQPCRVISGDVIPAGSAVDELLKKKGLTAEAKNAIMAAALYAPSGWVTGCDLTVLERWARNYALYRKIAKQVEDSKTQVVLAADNGSLYLNPLLNALLKVQQTLAACEKELGFTPASRARVRAKNDSSKGEENPFVIDNEA